MNGWLDLRPPPGWETRERGDRRVAEHGLVMLVWSQLLAPPPAFAEWVQDVFRAETPQGGMVFLERPARRESADGWSVVVVDARFQRDDGAPAGVARGAFYEILAHVAHAIVFARDAAELSRVWPVVDEAMLAARPDVSMLYAGPCDFYATPATDR